MQHAGVVSGLVLADASFGFYDYDAQIAVALLKRHRRRQPDDAATDNHQVRILHQSPFTKFQTDLARFGRSLQCLRN